MSLNDCLSESCKKYLVHVRGELDFYYVMRKFSKTFHFKLEYMFHLTIIKLKMDASNSYVLII